MRTVLDIGSWFGRGEVDPPGATPRASSAAVADVAVAKPSVADTPVAEPPNESPRSAAAPSVACPLEGTPERLVSLSEGLARVEEAVRTRLADGDRAERVIDRLEAEVKRLRQREEERRMESAVQRVIGLFDQVAAVAAGVRAREDEMAGPERELGKSIVALEQQMLELLDRLGAKTLVPAVASPFDAERQEAISTLETRDAEKHLTVASVRRPGFEFAGRVCRPAAVQVFRRNAGATSPAAKEPVS